MALASVRCKWSNGESTSGRWLPVAPSLEKSVWLIEAAIDARADYLALLRSTPGGNLAVADIEDGKTDVVESATEFSRFFAAMGDVEGVRVCDNVVRVGRLSFQTAVEANSAADTKAVFAPPNHDAQPVSVTITYTAGSDPTPRGVTSTPQLL